MGVSNNAHDRTHDHDVAREFLPRDTSQPIDPRTCVTSDGEELPKNCTLTGVVGESHLASETTDWR